MADQVELIASDKNGVIAMFHEGKWFSTTLQESGAVNAGFVLADIKKIEITFENGHKFIWWAKSPFGKESA